MEIKHVNDKTFNEVTGEALLDFYASWCGPCKMLSPVLEDIKDKIQIIKIDIDESRELCKKYGVMSVPTLIHIKDNNVNQIVGYIPKEELLKWLNK